MKKFRYEHKILEFHLDTFGHVNHATYLQIFEQARWEFLEFYGLGLATIQRDQIGPVVLEARCQYKSELKNREEIVIETEVTSMKNKYVFIIEQEMLNSDNKVAAKFAVEVAIMDLEKRKLLVPNEKWREILPPL